MLENIQQTLPTVNTSILEFNPLLQSILFEISKLINQGLESLPEKEENKLLI
jgi:hypothetical protein